jgi:flagellar hook protein FlgE
MMRSLFSGVSGLRNHQVRMDVIGNNVSNVNTVAFKAGRVTFKEGFAQLLQGASRPPGDQGGINPIQIGLGMQIGSIDTLFSQGNMETTGLNTDLAIQGDSFFVVAKGSEHFFTRSGNFQLDAGGSLVSPTNGFVVQGRMAVNGVFQDGIQDIVLPFGQKTAAKPTDSLKLGGNLDASAPIFTGTFDATGRADAANAKSWTETSISVFDSLGNQHDLKVFLWKTAANEWSWQLDGTNLPAGFTPANSTTQTLAFGTDGTLDLTASTPTTNPSSPSRRAALIRLDHDGPRQRRERHHVVLRHINAVMRDQDGYTAGTLVDFSIDRSGTISGAFSNGTNVVLAQIVLADFNNPSGLSASVTTCTASPATRAAPSSATRSRAAVDDDQRRARDVERRSRQEFTSMIVTQRGFQANSRVITNSDEMLQEVVNLKRS